MKVGLELTVPLLGDVDDAVHAILHERGLLPDATVHDKLCDCASCDWNTAATVWHTEGRRYGVPGTRFEMPTGPFAERQFITRILNTPAEVRAAVDGLFDVLDVVCPELRTLEDTGLWTLQVNVSGPRWDWHSLVSLYRWYCTELLVLTGHGDRPCFFLPHAEFFYGESLSRLSDVHAPKDCYIAGLDSADAWVRHFGAFDFDPVAYVVKHPEQVGRMVSLLHGQRMLRMWTNGRAESRFLASFQRATVLRTVAACVALYRAAVEGVDPARLELPLLEFVKDYVGPQSSVPGVVRA